MSDELKLHKAKERKAYAETLLRNELLSEAFKTLEQNYIKAWSGSNPADADARENYYRAVQILGDVRRHLLNTVSAGTLAEKELADLANKGRPRAA